jgi:hypothetical protein
MTWRSRLERSSIGKVLDIVIGPKSTGADFSTVLKIQQNTDSVKPHSSDQQFPSDPRLRSGLVGELGREFQPQ